MGNLGGRAAVLGAVGVVLGVVLTLVPATSAAADPTPTTTTLKVQGGRTIGDDVTLVARVNAAGRLPRGSVQFTLDDEPVGAPVSVNIFGQARKTFPATLGLHEYGASFVGTSGYADSTDGTLHMTIASGVRLTPQGVLTARLRATRTPGAYAAHIFSGRPIAGLALVFVAGGRLPNPFDNGGGEVICTAVTNARGYATCGEEGKRSAAFWRAHPAYVSGGQIHGAYGFAAARHPMHSFR